MTTSGEQCVMTPGATMMLMWFVDSSDILTLVITLTNEY